MTLINFESFFNIIDGKLEVTTKTRHGINPATLETLPPVPVSTLEDVDKAVDAAKRVAPVWAGTPIEERKRRVIKYADALLPLADQFGKMLTREQGRPLSAAIAEAKGSAEFLKGFARMSLPERIVEETEYRRVVTRYVPVGICVGIVPWNFPMTLLTFKLGPALIAGCTIILKPSPFTPYCGIKMIELAQQFFPPGVVQVLSGDDSLGPWLTEHPDVAKVSFTGSTATGIKVLKGSASTLKRVTLELGGNDPAIICSDVDITAVAAKVAIKALTNSGQNAMQYERLKKFVAFIESDKLKIAAGDINDTFPKSSGYFMNPLIIDNPPEDSQVVVEEPFGPILPVLTWDTEEDVITRANNSVNGLGASVWSRDIAQAERMVSQLQAGMLWINTHTELQVDAVFGGHKHSGFGSELGIEGLKAYCLTQSIVHDKVGASSQ
ncbi:aldehyde dehydrogenase [Trichoderma arundinaceum]|uniref:aldehyde dehydrogenase (NAD(+)) n=1 Tax=Trichoderma arundinaceum TaxID=490622 RepID=A0A395NJE2_TRIAR|nr:aldehyde dehydrogenase [Trichoderma arundinaceum]